MVERIDPTKAPEPTGTSRAVSSRTPKRIPRTVEASRRAARARRQAEPRQVPADFIGPLQPGQTRAGPRQAGRPTTDRSGAVTSRRPARAAKKPPRVVTRESIGPLQPGQRRETAQEQRDRLDAEFIKVTRRERLAVLARVIPDEFAGKAQVIRKIQTGGKLTASERETCATPGRLRECSPTLRI